MSIPTFLGRIFWALSILTLAGCYHIPYNNFHADKSTLAVTALGAGMGAGSGAVVGMVAGSTGVGVAIGGASGALLALRNTQYNAVVTELEKQGIQLIHYGNRTSLIIPTDHYFVFNSAQLNDLRYQGLNTIIKLIKYYPCSDIYIAGFTDDIGSNHHKKLLSQTRAETILTFLWANNIQAKHLQARGYGDRFNIGDNRSVHGSAYNRRIEINIIHKPNRSNHPVIMKNIH
ncbi:MAG: OmpA family protein [Legionella sp.]